jgi:glutamate-1-semialdehyde 2,1-aminomutase
MSGRGSSWCSPPSPPKNAAAMREALDADLLSALHLWLINRGVLIAPFHTMMLVSPMTEDAAIDRLVAAVDGFGARVSGMSVSYS